MWVFTSVVSGSSRRIGPQAACGAAPQYNRNALLERQHRDRDARPHRWRSGCRGWRGRGSRRERGWRGKPGRAGAAAGVAGHARVARVVVIAEHERPSTISRIEANSYHLEVSRCTGIAGWSTRNLCSIDGASMSIRRVHERLKYRQRVRERCANILVSPVSGVSAVYGALVGRPVLRISMGQCSGHCAGVLRLPGCRTAKCRRNFHRREAVCRSRFVDELQELLLGGVQPGRARVAVRQRFGRRRAYRSPRHRQHAGSHRAHRGQHHQASNHTHPAARIPAPAPRYGHPSRTLAKRKPTPGPRPRGLPAIYGRKHRGRPV